MEAIRLVETEHRFFVKRPQDFHPEQGRFGETYFAAISKGGNDVKKENNEEITEKGDTTKELAKVVLAALTSHREWKGKLFSKYKAQKEKGRILKHLDSK